MTILIFILQVTAATNAVGMCSRYNTTCRARLGLCSRRHARLGTALCSANCGESSALNRVSMMRGSITLYSKRNWSICLVRKYKWFYVNRDNSWRLRYGLFASHRRNYTKMFLYLPLLWSNMMPDRWQWYLLDASSSTRSNFCYRNKTVPHACFINGRYQSTHFCEVFVASTIFL